MRKRVLFEEKQGPSPRGDGVRVLVGEVFYDEGGSNFFTGTSVPRGYYVMVRPEDIIAGGRLRRYTAFTGVRALLAEAKRFSAKTLAAIEVPAELLARLRAQVAAKEGERNDRAQPMHHPATTAVHDGYH